MIEPPHLLPLAAGLAFLGVSAARSLISRVRDGVNPYAIDHGRPVEGFLGAVFLALILGLVVYLVGITVRPQMQDALGLAAAAKAPTPRWIAAGLMAASTVWTGWAQLAMGASWRVGIPNGETLPLRRKGPFAVSRNPIFLGMLVFLLGLAAWSPTAVTLAALAVAYVAVEVQVRLEEAYLSAAHGLEYETYRRQVRRWL